jgi:hypothetical protein
MTTTPVPRTRCTLVAGPLPSDLFLAAKYLRFAANEAVRSARPARGTLASPHICATPADGNGDPGP